MAAASPVALAAKAASLRLVWKGEELNFNYKLQLNLIVVGGRKFMIIVGLDK